ncbi:MAG: extracellular solute-binding protein [Clostridiales bacterium]|nr:extracellular solute-binding protein [Clostridiales bacterium]
MKKLLATLLASTMAFSAIAGLVACGGGDNGGNGGGDVNNKLADDLPTVSDVNDPFAGDNEAVAACTIEVWAPEKTVAAFETLAAKFTSNEYHNGKYANVTINFTPKGEDKAQEALATDPEQGADVFFFPSDHLDKFVQDDILQELRGNVGSYYTKAISERDSEGTYSAALSKDGYMLAFPATADNGYYLWYDGDFFSDSDVETLDGMMEKAKKANKNIIWDYGTGWYTPTFFYGMGCNAGYVGDNYEIDFNSANGKIAAEAMIRYLVTDNVMENEKPCLIKGAIGDDIVAGMKDGSVVAGIGGGWFAGDLPANAKATKLPTFTAKIDGKDVQKQMYTFFGGKYCGVNSKKTNISVSMAFANFLTSYEGQVARYNADNAGPSNKEAAKLPAVQSDKALSALLAQAAVGSYVQGNQDPFWDPMQSFCAEIADGTTTIDNLQTALDNLVAAIKQKA